MCKMGMHFVACTEEIFPKCRNWLKLEGYAKESGATITLTEDVGAEQKMQMLSIRMYGYPWVSRTKYGKKRIRELSPYKVTKKVMENAGEQAIFLHCLPAFHDLKTKIGKQIHDKFGLDRYGSYR